METIIDDPRGGCPVSERNISGKKSLRSIRVPHLDPMNATVIVPHPSVLGDNRRVGENAFVFPRRSILASNEVTKMACATGHLHTTASRL